MRFLHTADWHLGRIFHGMHLTGDQSYILETIEEIIKDEAIEAYIIAGDIYDRAVPPPEAVELLGQHLEIVAGELKIPVIMIAGNHDSAERLNFCSGIMRNSNLFIYGNPVAKTQEVILEDKHGPVRFFPFPYGDPERFRELYEVSESITHESAYRFMMESLNSLFPKKCREVAITHAFISGGQSSDSERPLVIGSAGNVSADLFNRFNYTALGHLHSPQSINSTLRYSGSIMKYSIAEANHSKSVSVVEINDTGDVKITEIPLRPKKDLRIITGSFKEIMERSDSGSREDYVVVRLTDVLGLYEPMNRLRERYPNIIHLERVNSSVAQNSVFSAGREKKDDLELFLQFYKVVTERDVAPAAMDVISDAIKSVVEAEA